MCPRRNCPTSALAFFQSVRSASTPRGVSAKADRYAGAGTGAAGSDGSGGADFAATSAGNSSHATANGVFMQISRHLAGCNGAQAPLQTDYGRGDQEIGGLKPRAGGALTNGDACVGGVAKCCTFDADTSSAAASATV